MTLNLRHHKKLFFVLFLIVTIVLFFNNGWISKVIYPIPYKDEIIISAKHHKVNPSLITAIIRVESNFKKHKVSNKTAMGLMQIMPNTANWIIEQAKFQPDIIHHITDAEVNIEVGTWYVASLYKQFATHMKGRSDVDQITIIAAAYNAGPGNVDKWLDDETWNGSSTNIIGIPYGETRHYVSRILYYYKKYNEIYAEDWISSTT